MSKLNALLIIIMLSIVSAFTLFMSPYGGFNPPSTSSTTIGDELKSFKSLAEFKGFLYKMRRISESYSPKFRVWIGDVYFEAAVKEKAPTLSATQGVPFSKTNVQVEGVDEPDVIKTDGQYIYLIRNNVVYIIYAYPPENAKIVSKLNINGTLIGMFLYNNKLIVFTSQHSFMVKSTSGEIIRGNVKSTPPIHVPITPNTTIYIFDISDRNNPVLEDEVKVEGYYIGSRLISSYLYLIVQTPVINETMIPRIIYNNVYTRINVNKIKYIDVPAYSYKLITIVMLNLESKDIEYESFLWPAITSTIYVSRENIYVTAFDWFKNIEETHIFRIQISEGKVKVSAHGIVPGTVLNQFSMDEYNGYFRIATTTRILGGQRKLSNNLYILNTSLDVIGKLENIAVGERIYAVRFLGDIGFIVTYKIIDPLFVIDLHDPQNPEIIGELKIPGFSCYLHPINNKLLVGIGKEVTIGNGRERVDGVKISLFNIENLSDPVEIDKLVFNETSNTPVIYDHKAFQYYPERSLMFIPLRIARKMVIVETHNKTSIKGGNHGFAVIKETMVPWQGLIIIKIDGNKLTMLGNISHINIINNDEDIYSGSYNIDRCAYIGDYLYVISNAYVTVHSLDDLEVISIINLKS